MKISESIVSNLLLEIEALTLRLRNIKQSFKSTSNIRLRERLIIEKKSIFARINEIYKVANFLNKSSKEKISYSGLLLEKTSRTISDTSIKSSLFFL